SNAAIVSRTISRLPTMIRSTLCSRARILASELGGRDVDPRGADVPCGAAATGLDLFEDEFTDVGEEGEVIEVLGIQPSCFGHAFALRSAAELAAPAGRFEHQVQDVAIPRRIHCLGDAQEAADLDLE